MGTDIARTWLETEPRDRFLMLKKPDEPVPSLDGSVEPED
jgi:hypothetical protein